MLFVLLVGKNTSSGIDVNQFIKDFIWARPNFSKRMFTHGVSSRIKGDQLFSFVNDVFKVLDLIGLFYKIAYEGNPSYQPAMMLKNLFYSYAMKRFNRAVVQPALSLGGSEKLWSQPYGW